jgi:outer membrane protein assembly factor BamB
MIYLSTGFQTPSLLAVRVDGSGDVTRSHIEWRLNRGAPLTPSPILVGNELYVVSDFGIATCVNALTGDVHWQERVGGNHSASPIFANGHIYFQNEEGITTVIKPGTEFEVLARNQLDGSMLASMAAVGSALYIRTESHLYRIEETP